jgi:hypothetical protein
MPPEQQVPEMNYFPDGTFGGSSVDPIESRLTNVERLLYSHKHTTKDRTQLLKQIPATIKSITDAGSSYVIAVEECDTLIITAQSVDVTFSNPTQSSYNGQKLLIRIQDDGLGVCAISWGSEFRAGTNALPTTTISGKYKYIGFMRNTDDVKWDLVGLSDEA